MTQPKRDLLARFSAQYPSKKALAEGMATERKSELFLTMLLTVRYFLPDHATANLTFFQQVLTGEKKVLPLDSVHPERVPTFPEISVNNLLHAVAKDTQIMSYLPDQLPGKKVKLSKLFLWTVIVTLRPQWAKALVKSCIEARNNVSLEEAKSRKMVPISAEVMEKLVNCPFIPCKYFYLTLIFASAKTKTRVTVLTDARTRKPPTKKRSYQLAFGVETDPAFRSPFKD